MEKKRVALLAGGCSSEREIALKSAAQIAESLPVDRYDVKVVDVRGREWIHTCNGEQWRMDLNDFSLTVEGVKHTFDCALIVIHGTPGEDGMLQGYLEMMGVPYCSSSMTSSVITFDKVTTKRTVANIEGLNLAREVFYIKGERLDSEKIVSELGLPLFIKPNASGSSFGVSRVTSKDEIEVAVEAALKESDTVLIEEAIVGREFGCGVLLTEDKEFILPITEISTKRDFFDFEAKYTSGLSEEITPAPIDESLKVRLNNLTRAAYRACRCSGVVRIDFIVDNQGEPYLIEINSIPGLSSGSLVPQQARAAGLSIGELFSVSIESVLSKGNY